jgi:hypothetical protein
VICEESKGAVFFVCILQKCNHFVIDEKEGAGNLWRSIEVQYRSNEQISTIVDADDKNCLAQLTVARKINQGVRQWPYIIAGVLFFRSFFCTSKRKNNKMLLVIFNI